jgi:dipeptidyl aminopeptidase/acylaminoacyl peptidase
MFLLFPRGVAATALATTLALTLAGCAIPTASPEATATAAAGPVLAPNPNLLAQGIPPIPQALAERVARYTDFRGHAFADWHPQRPEMLVVHRKAGDTINQIHWLKGPMGAAEQLTRDGEPVTEAYFEPREGRYIVFTRGSGGNEAAQIYRLDLDSRRVTQVSPPDERYQIVGWLKGSGQLLAASVPLDRTAEGGRRTAINTRYWVVDPLQPTSRRVIAELPGAGWFRAEVSPDGRQAAITRYLSATQSEVWLMDLASGERRRLLPADGAAAKATHFAGPFSPDGRGLFFTSDRAGEFRELMHLDIASGQVSRLSGHIPWDASGMDLSADGRRLAVQFNIEGRDELRLFDVQSRSELPRPAQPAGNIGAASFHPALPLVALSVNSAQSPSQLSVLDLPSGGLQRWTQAQAPAGVDMGGFRDQQIVRWPSFDGRRISGLLSLPPARFDGKRPVIIDIHGGPESQATVGFLNRLNYLVEEMGIAILRPNVRGSAGFGKTFLDLDNGMKREDSVKDIGALLDWIATQPHLDSSRVLVTGGSYGGYMSLAVATHYADRIAGAVDVVGISNFVTFLETTESYRRDLRRVEYGDERDPAMRAFLQRISPLTNAHRITKPLYVVQGKNDPRVPYTEAEQIVAKARANGTPVWYLRAENEGHGFARKENADFHFYAFVTFVEQVLLR